MRIEFRLSLGIDAFSKISGMAFACSVGSSLPLAKQPLDSAAVASERCRMPEGQAANVTLPGALRKPAHRPQNHAVLRPRQHRPGNLARLFARPSGCAEIGADFVSLRCGGGELLCERLDGLRLRAHEPISSAEESAASVSLGGFTVGA